MNELLNLDSASNFPIDGRELHDRLGVETAYKDWFPRMCEYGFAEGVDFRSNLSESTGGRPARQHSLTLSMAKEICMLQRTELGRQVRRYLIDVESAWNTPEQIMARALRMADETIGRLTGQVKLLEADNSRLAVDNQIMEPKAAYFDSMVDRNLLTNFRETAKQLGVKERAFVNFLLEHKYVYRDKKGKLMPYAEKNKGLFDIKECFNEKTEWSGTQTLITPKGRETFRLLTQGLT
jgi:anti-repressor protein